MKVMALVRNRKFRNIIVAFVIVLCMAAGVLYAAGVFSRSSIGRKSTHVNQGEETQLVNITPSSVVMPVPTASPEPSVTPAMDPHKETIAEKVEFVVQQGIAKVAQVLSGVSSHHPGDSVKQNPAGNSPDENTSASKASESNTSAHPHSTSGNPDKKENSGGASQVKILPKSVNNKVDSIAEGEVSGTDLMEVVKIVGGKLSLGEIKYLFDSAKSDYWETTSVEDIEKARSILFSKLTDEDLAKLREIGRKYGRSMDIIRKDLDVAETKEKQMRAKGLID